MRQIRRDEIRHSARQFDLAQKTSLKLDTRAARRLVQAKKNWRYGGSVGGTEMGIIDAWYGTESCAAECRLKKASTSWKIGIFTVGRKRKN